MVDVVPAVPHVSERVRALHAQMTLEEKLAQIVGYWLDQHGTVAPMQSEMAAGQQASSALSEVTRDGLGHYTRVYGTRPVDPVERAAWLWAEQRRLKRETRLGIPALVHEEVPDRSGRVAGRHLPDARWRGAPASTPSSCTRPRTRSASRCDCSASTRVWRRCSTSSATRAGAASTSASARTRTSSPPSVRRSSGVCRTPACTPRSSTSSATRRRGPAATTRRSAPARARSPTTSSRRSRWRSSRAARGR